MCWLTNRYDHLSRYCSQWFLFQSFASVIMLICVSIKNTVIQKSKLREHLNWNTCSWVMMCQLLFCSSFWSVCVCVVPSKLLNAVGHYANPLCPPSGVHVPAVPQSGLYPFPGRVSQRHQASKPPGRPRDGHPQTLWLWQVSNRQCLRKYLSVIFILFPLWWLFVPRCACLVICLLVVLSFPHSCPACCGSLKANSSWTACLSASSSFSKNF